jgi:hypothetical protein
MILGFLIILISLPLALFLVRSKTVFFSRAFENIPGGGNTPKIVKTMVIQYIPPASEGGILHYVPTSQVAKNNDPTDDAQELDNFIKNRFLTALTNGTKYHGYASPNATPAITYTLADEDIHTEYNPPPERAQGGFSWELPKSDPSSGGTYADLPAIFSKYDICNVAKSKNISFIVLAGGFGYGKGHGLVFEDYITGNKGIPTNGPLLKGPEFCDDKTIEIVNLNYERGLSEVLESYGHYLENMFTYLRPEFRLWSGYSLNFSRNVSLWGLGHACGSAHNPPNARCEYDRSNPDGWITAASGCNLGTPKLDNPPSSVLSSCQDWKPDGSGIKTQLDCHAWGCHDGQADGADWLVWWMQNMPGLNNNLTDNVLNAPIPNWWAYVADPDNCYNDPFACQSSGKTITAGSKNNVDTDQDEVSDYYEKWIGTDPNNKCGPNAWTLDLNDDCYINDDDIDLFNQFLATGQYNKRYDLNADGVVDTFDLSMIKGKLGFIPDTDNDSFNDVKEAFMGTDPRKSCADNASSNAWPPDFNNDGRVDDLDIGLLTNDIYTHIYNKRYDMNADGFLDNLDIEYFYRENDSQSTYQGRTYYLYSCKDRGDDYDHDGFTDAEEIAIGTDPTKVCGTDAWPSDVDSSGFTSTADLSRMINSFTDLGHQYKKRYDFNLDGSVDYKDTTAMRPFFGKDCHSFPAPTGTYTPPPSADPFSNMSATFTKDKAQFNFSYSGTPDAFNVALGTASDLVYGTFSHFAGGSSNPLINLHPMDTWDGYKCGQVLYWAIRSNYVPHTSSVQGPVTVNCDATPTPSPSASSSTAPSPTAGPSTSPTTSPTASPSPSSSVVTSVSPTSSPISTASPVTYQRGDGNHDSMVDLKDLSMLLSKIGQTNEELDLNSNGQLDSIDVTMMVGLLRSLGKL